MKKQTKKIKDLKEGKQDLKDYLKILASNQKRLYDMCISLQQQLIIQEVKIRQIEQRLDFIDGGHYGR